jgi:hypothetical protein
MNEWPKAITTASIWISIGFALGFGLFRMNFSGGRRFHFEEPSGNEFAVWSDKGT